MKEEKVPEQAANAAKLREEEHSRILTEGSFDLATVEQYAEETAKHGRTISIFDPVFSVSDKLFLLGFALMLMFAPVLTVLVLNRLGFNG